MHKTVSGWLMLEDGENKGKIALQKRSFCNNQNSCYICQATWAGKVELGEDNPQAAQRECKEELGEDFYNQFNFSNFKMIGKKDFKINGENWESYNYFGTIKECAINLVKMHKEAFPNFIFINKQDDIFPVSSGKNPEKHIVLHDDQYIVLKEILNGN